MFFIEKDAKIGTNQKHKSSIKKVPVKLTQKSKETKSEEINHG